MAHYIFEVNTRNHIVIYTHTHTECLSIEKSLMYLRIKISLTRGCHVSKPHKYPSPIKCCHLSNIFHFSFPFPFPSISPEMLSFRVFVMLKLQWKTNLSYKSCKTQAFCFCNLRKKKKKKKKEKEASVKPKLFLIQVTLPQKPQFSPHVMGFLDCVVFC